MGKKYNFDYIIIGSGPAGSTAALTLAKNSKKRIALVEGQAFGGNNLNSRDIPYAVSLDFSHSFTKFINCPEVNGQEFHYNFPTIINHQKSVINSFEQGKKIYFEERGITCIEGYAHFLDAHTIAVNNVQYSSENFILATGSKLNTMGISGADTNSFLAPDSAIKIPRLPKYALIIGGGPTGCEIASYYAELGSKVIIMERENRLLPHEDEDTSSCITDYFTHKLGILVVTNAEVVAIEKDQVSKRIIYSSNGQEKLIRIDNIILATGSKPHSDYGLENAKVKLKQNGAIAVNKFFQTSAKNIYAIGDCIGGESSTERSEYQASLLASNLLKKSKSLPSYKGFARITNTMPEIVTIGFTEQRLKKLKRKYKKSIIYFKDLPASKIHFFSSGFVKILTDRKNHIVGACIVGPNANLMAPELSLSIRHNLNILEIASTPHTTNSYVRAIKLAAKQLIK